MKFLLLLFFIGLFGEVPAQRERDLAPSEDPLETSLNSNVVEEMRVLRSPLLEKKQRQCDHCLQMHPKCTSIAKCEPCKIYCKDCNADVKVGARTAPTKCQMCMESPKCRKLGRCESCKKFCQEENVDEEVSTMNAASTERVKEPSDILELMSSRQKVHHDVERDTNEKDTVAAPLRTNEPVSINKVNVPTLIATTGNSEMIKLHNTAPRYYTIGALKPGPKMNILLHMFDILKTDNVEKLIVIAKLKSDQAAGTEPPVILDISRQFSSGNLGSKTVGSDIQLTHEIDRELQMAGEKKKATRGESHLTPEEVDKIIAHAISLHKSPAEALPNEIHADVSPPEKVQSEDILARESEPSKEELQPVIDIRGKEALPKMGKTAESEQPSETHPETVREAEQSHIKEIESSSLTKHTESPLRTKIQSMLSRMEKARHNAEITGASADESTQTSEEQNVPLPGKTRKEIIASIKKRIDEQKKALEKATIVGRQKIEAALVKLRERLHREEQAEEATVGTQEEPQEDPANICDSKAEALVEKSSKGLETSKGHMKKVIMKKPFSQEKRDEEVAAPFVMTAEEIGSPVATSTTTPTPEILTPNNMAKSMIDEVTDVPQYIIQKMKNILENPRHRFQVVEDPTIGSAHNEDKTSNDPVLSNAEDDWSRYTTSTTSPTAPLVFPTFKGTTMNVYHGNQREAETEVPEIEMKRQKIDWLEKGEKDSSEHFNAFGKIIPATDVSKVVHHKYPSDLKLIKDAYFYGDMELPLRMKYYSDGTIKVAVDKKKYCQCGDDQCVSEAIADVKNEKDQQVDGREFEDVAVGMNAPEIWNRNAMIQEEKVTTSHTLTVEPSVNNEEEENMGDEPCMETVGEQSMGLEENLSDEHNMEIDENVGAEQNETVSAEQGETVGAEQNMQQLENTGNEQNMGLNENVRDAQNAKLKENSSSEESFETTEASNSSTDHTELNADDNIIEPTQQNVENSVNIQVKRESNLARKLKERKNRVLSKLDRRKTLIKRSPQVCEGKDCHTNYGTIQYKRQLDNNIVQERVGIVTDLLSWMKDLATDSTH